MGGQDKGLVQFSGRPMIEWVIDAVSPQVRTLLLNANRNQDAYARFGYPVIADRNTGFQGPLEGFASALAVARTDWIVSVPCDGPFPAPDLVARLSAALIRDRAEIAVATDGHRMQPVYALIPVALKGSLEDCLSGGERKIDRWYARHRVALADFSDCRDCFANINSPEDSRRLEQELARR